MRSRFFSPRFLLTLIAILGVLWISPESLYPQGAPPAPGAKPPTPATQALLTPYENMKTPSLITQAVVLSLMSLLPFIVMILTSFMKIVIVLSLLRSALGVQQAPPNQIINGVAFMLSLFIMYPTMLKMYDASQSVINTTKAPDSILSPQSVAIHHRRLRTRRKSLYGISF